MHRNRREDGRLGERPETTRHGAAASAAAPELTDARLRRGDGSLARHHADDEHDPEGATIAFERSQVDALVQQAQRPLDEIAAAYDRVEAGTYGQCEACGADIGDDRLDARPTAGLCIRCATSARP